MSTTIATATPTLYGMADEIVLLLAAAEDLDPTLTDEERQAQLAEINQALSATIAAVPEKVDRFGAFILRLEDEQEYLKKTAKRLLERATMFSRWIERLHQHARAAIELLPRNPKGGYQRLDGREHTISLRAGRNKTEITSLEALSPQFRRITVQMPEILWIDLRKAFLTLSEGSAEASLEIVKIVALDAPLTPITQAIEQITSAALAAGQEPPEWPVPGARIVLGESSVIVK